MSTSSISSSLLPYSSYALASTQLKSETVSSLFNFGSSSSSISSLTDLVASGMTDISMISAVSASLSSVAQVADNAGISDEIMGNVQLFVETLQGEGTDDISIIQYLTRIKEMIASDPEGVVDLFTIDESAASEVEVEESDIVSDESADEIDSS